MRIFCEICSHTAKAFMSLLNAHTPCTRVVTFSRKSKGPNLLHNGSFVHPNDIGAPICLFASIQQLFSELASVILIYTPQQLPYHECNKTITL